MTTDGHLPARRKTSSSERTADTSPAELSTLVEQLAECQWMPGRVAALRCLAEDIYGYTVAHFVTTVLVAALVLCVALLVL